ncbi:hypothetical protein [Massilia phyllosphaerae]|uniref:hypothetical protein n=1 Tax=Massilia phyllosphaerae TaxID=3106034 RepID=UPI002B1CCEFD|nr:hypothetical protein [Massilia sp. SGZ-792]
MFDRSGLVLPSSMPAKAVWAIPEDFKRASPDTLHALAGLLEMPRSELLKKLDSDRNFVYLKCQVEMETVYKIEKLGI